MIQVHHLTKVYEDPDGGEVVAVRDASLTCNAGEIYGLLGANGAGKTTTLRCLATILTPTSGTASVAGHDLIKDPQAVRRNIGFLSASTGLYARLTPRETLRFFGELHGLGRATLEKRVDEVIALFDISGYADRPNDRLSTGMKQRVGLARAVVHDPPVLILDEPTSGLDPIVSRTVEQAVQSLAAAGKCVLFSTHLLAQAEDICTRIGVIGKGRVLGEGTIPELCAATGTNSLRAAFFALADRAEDEAPSAAGEPGARGFEVVMPAGSAEAEGGGADAV
ncbi:MAG TPA: ABC transporter ATP-binding protein [Tepidisphaeraceae bacterium]|nr:ABC transporter ATP-binding protein [Tepidisphaeraceae bacterium]